MMVAGYNTLDLTMTRDDGSEGIGTVEKANAVHVADAAIEGRMVQEDKGWDVGFLCELAIQEGKALIGQRAVALAGHQGIESDEPHGTGLDHEIERA
jgi:hypothetical protein